MSGAHSCSGYNSKVDIIAYDRHLAELSLTYVRRERGMRFSVQRTGYVEGWLNLFPHV
jgi:hypothetical protein